MEAFVGILIDTLNSMIQKELGLLCGVAGDMQKLSSLLSTVKAVLEEAEQKQFTDKAIQLWLQKLNGIAYEIDDLLDDYAAEASRVKYKNSGCFSSMCYPIAGNLVFRHKIGTRMKEIFENFNAIADERIKLGLSDQKRGSNHCHIDAKTRETGSLPNEPDLVLGRDEEKVKIVEILVNQVRDKQNVSVLPIVGVGGLGKTTFAQLVFNDQRITEHFELKLWVWVSEDFDVKRIIKALIECNQRTPAEALDLDPLQRKLQELLRGKRYLVVLDDIWNDNQEEWEKLKIVLDCGSRGSSVVTTTRMENVAEIMGTLRTHYLSSLSDNQCWSLFRQRAFGHQEMQKYPNLVAIGKDIVNKCGGVPLAAKALGGFLRFKKEETEWNFVKYSEIWNLPQDKTHILPALRLSYLNLPVELRGCFAYCAIFPKGSEIEKEELIHLWMANGLISSKVMMEVEDVGDAMLTELHYRSLFQAVEKDKFGRVLTFKMHDLVHDLAQSVMEGEHDGIQSDSTIRHLTLNFSDDLLITAFPIRRIRGTDQCPSLLAKYGSLRTFNARSTGWGKKFTELPAAVSKLKHLRCLNLSGSDIVKLPNSICDLWNLQIFNLNDCTELQRLPKGMRFLRNLRHLCLQRCWKLTHMPNGIGQLTCLRTLSKVVPGGEKCFKLSELRDLNYLGGELTIEHLERVERKKDPQEANLIAKQSLCKLYLEWDSETRSQQYNDEEVLEALKPCLNVQFLHIRGFKGTSFPAWNSTLTNVIGISISDCNNSTRLPVLGNLPHLQRLAVKRSAAEYIDDDEEEQVGDRANESSASRFPSLKQLTISSMPNLKGLLGREGLVQGTALKVFPRLQSLGIQDCSMLTLPLPRMLSLKELRVRKCPSNFAWASISSLASLNSVVIADVEGLSCFPEEIQQHLSLLESLRISEISDLRALPSRSLASLTALKELSIRGCPELESLPEEGLQGLASLQELYLIGCNNLVSLSMGIKPLKFLTYLCISRSNATALPEELKHVPALQRLELVHFPSLTSLPDWFADHLTSLRHLTIRSCPKLETLPSNIQMITTLQHLTIQNCQLLGPGWEREGVELA